MTDAEQTTDLQARRLIILVGLEGSGKSSLAAALAQNGWAVVAQGSSAARSSQHCLKLLQQGREVVVDRCNIRADERSSYTRLQQQSQAIFVASCTLHLAAHVCAARALQKDSAQDHEHVLDRIYRCESFRHKALVYSLWADPGPCVLRQQEEYQPVLQGPEGFSAVYDMHRQADINSFVAQMGPATSAYVPPGHGQPQDPRRPHAAASHILQLSHAAAASQAGPSISRQPVSSAAPDRTVSFQWADYSAPQQIHAQARRRNWWDQNASSAQPSDSPLSASTRQSLGRVQGTKHVDPVRLPRMQHAAVGPQTRHPAELVGVPNMLLANGHLDTYRQSDPHALLGSVHSAPQATYEPAAIPTVAAVQQGPPLLQVQPTRHPLGGGPLLPSVHLDRPGAVSSPALTVGQRHSEVQPLQNGSSHEMQPAGKKSKHKKRKAEPAGSPEVYAAADLQTDDAGAALQPGQLAASPAPVNNIVTGPQSNNSSQWQQFTHTFQPPRLPVDESDPRPIILFDLNGTLTQHTAARNSTGITLLRPGTDHLAKLQAHFRLGIFSSASQRTVRTVIPMLQAAAGAGQQEPLFGDASLVFHRSQTLLAPPSHREAGGKAWDTVKPLYKLFRKLHRVLLVDDDAFKSVEGEAINMILVPCWNHHDEQDMCIATLVDALLEGPAKSSAEADLRQSSAAISEKVRTASQSCAQATATTPLAGLSDSLAKRQNLVTNILLEDNGKELTDDAFIADSSSGEEEGQLHIASKQ